MNTASGISFMTGVILLLLLFWGESYGYFRQTHPISCPVVVEYFTDSSGARGCRMTPKEVILYSGKSRLEAAFYYLHIPLFWLEKKLRKDSVPDCSLFYPEGEVTRALIPTLP